jgi:nondiscriminating glutamyl-tRNA synthetase
VNRPRVRFAPSPTGLLHVGNARTALFNWLQARRYGGALILRIEDTDQVRSTAASERGILDDLRWLGLDWDEGPDVGGPCAPYRQSERGTYYGAAAQILFERGRAYWCFCTPAELDADRHAALAAGLPPKYSGRCRVIDPAVAARRVVGGESAATRFAVPDTDRDITFPDLVRGDVTVSTAVIGDFVIVGSDGLPQYNFAAAVDDGAMGVTHVVRGEDHISNTPRQLLIYEALGLAPPAFAHLSLVLGPDHAPLSKRHGATSVAEFRQRGYLPEALVNYLALLGWSPGDGEEMLPVQQMAERFDLGRVGHSAAVFDVDKLAWMNRQYLKAAPLQRLVGEAWPHFERAGYVSGQSAAAREYVGILLSMVVAAVDRVEQMPQRARFVFEWDADAAAAGVSVEPDGPRVVAAFGSVLEGGEPMGDREGFRAAAARTRELTGLKGKALFHPIRVALTGDPSGPELDVAVPAIERGAALPAGSGVATVVSCVERVRQVVRVLGERAS